MSLIGVKCREKSKLKSVILSDEAHEFILWFAKQDVTLPALFVDHLKWKRYKKDEIKRHFKEIIDACSEAKAC